MIDQISKYIISIVCACAVCSMLTSFTSKSSAGGMIQMIAGIILAVVVISPLTSLQLKDFESYFDMLHLDSSEFSVAGQEAANQETTAIIKRELEAYIIEKANSLNLTVTAQVFMTDDYPSVPCSISIEGTASPYSKKVLTEFITNELGIPEENQTWK